MLTEPKALEERAKVTSPAITIGILAVIIYGSLYPFRFYQNPDPAGPIGALLSTWRTFGGRGDVTANFILYLPLGFFAVRGGRCRALLSFFATVAGAMALSTGMELLQFYEAVRFSQMSDVYANTAGAIVGAAIGVFSRGTNLPTMHAFRRRDSVMMLIVCWLGYRLFPYVPVIDLHKYWDAVKPLIYSPVVGVVDLYRHVVTWLALSMLLETLFAENVSRFAAWLLFLLVLFSRVLIIDTVLSPAEVLGGVIGITLWNFVFRRVPARARIVAGLFIGLVVLQALEPFQFLSIPRRFGWIPFRGFLNGSNYAGVASFLEKTFNYGCLVWLLARAGYSWAVATGAGAALIFALRLGQVYIPGRSAEITDVIILLIVAGIMKLVGEDPVGAGNNVL